jgi:hypothetical protein
MNQFFKQGVLLVSIVLCIWACNGDDTPAGTTSHDLFQFFPRLETYDHAHWYGKSTNQISMLGKRVEF